MEPIWINKQALLFLHSESLAEHGGLEGFRDEGLFDSGLIRPKNLYLYEQENSIPILAASYAVGLAKNHPFIDGNKRVSFLSIGLFLGLNRLGLSATQAEATQLMIDLAAGFVSEESIANWLKINTKVIR
jgi:death-on-curing protein